MVGFLFCVVFCQSGKQLNFIWSNIKKKRLLKSKLKTKPENTLSISEHFFVFSFFSKISVFFFFLFFLFFLNFGFIYLFI